MALSKRESLKTTSLNMRFLDPLKQLGRTLHNYTSSSILLAIVHSK